MIRSEHYEPNSPFEAIKIIRYYNLNFCLGNVVKYVLRYMKSGNKLDLKKALTTKMYYYGKNAEITRHPKIHALALLDAIKHEKVSKMVEALFQIRVDSIKDQAIDSLEEEKLEKAIKSVESYHRKIFL